MLTSEHLAELDGGNSFDSDGKKQRPPSHADLLVTLALDLFRLGLSATGEPFTVRRTGPNVAIMFRGSRDALRARLSCDFRKQHQKTPSASALADALTTLEGEALDLPGEPVALRVAEHNDGLVLDLGTPDGSCVVIGPGGWAVEAVSPVLFRRTALTGPLPIPAAGGDLSDLKALLNVDEKSWPLAQGWLVASFLPGIGHPVLIFGGEHGTGKTTAARFLLGLIDASPAMVRSVPRDAEGWAMTASGSWGVLVDNVSGIPEWWSNALCKAVSGDGWVRRQLYTDSSLAVLSFRRCVMLTSIDAGAMRGDLGDRLLIVDLERIPDEARRGEAEMDQCYASIRAGALGALLDLVSAVLRELPNVKLATMPRMADFARVLGAMDRVSGSEALPVYLNQRERIAGDVIEGDLVGAALVVFIDQESVWEGSAGALLEEISPENPPRDWPKNARAMAARLRELAPALRAVGVAVTKPGKRKWRVARELVYPTAPTAQPPEIGPHDPETGCLVGTVAPAVGPDRPSDRPTGNGTPDPASAVPGQSGGTGGPIHPISGGGDDGGEWGEL